jgi:hypothetical protein
LDGTVENLLDYQQNLFHWKISKDYFMFNMRRSGLDAEDLWRTSYRRADAWLDPVLATEKKYTGVTTEVVDEERWLANILRSRGMNVPDRRRKEKLTVIEEPEGVEGLRTHSSVGIATTCTDPLEHRTSPLTSFFPGWSQLI